MTWVKTIMKWLAILVPLIVAIYETLKKLFSNPRDNGPGETPANP